MWSTRRVNELAALQIDPPSLIFPPESVVLHSSIRFLPKLVSRFHLSQGIVLPMFFPTVSSENEHELHYLNVGGVIILPQENPGVM